MVLQTPYAGQRDTSAPIEHMGIVAENVNRSIGGKPKALLWRILNTAEAMGWRDHLTDNEWEFVDFVAKKASHAGWNAPLTIATKTFKRRIGFCDSTVRKLRASLERQGAISVERGYGALSGRRAKPPVYRILYENLAKPYEEVVVLLNKELPDGNHCMVQHSNASEVYERAQAKAEAALPVEAMFDTPVHRVESAAADVTTDETTTTTIPVEPVAEEDAYSFDLATQLREKLGIDGDLDNHRTSLIWSKVCRRLITKSVSVDDAFKAIEGFTAGRDEPIQYLTYPPLHTFMMQKVYAPETTLQDDARAKAATARMNRTSSSEDVALDEDAKDDQPPVNPHGNVLRDAVQGAQWDAVRDAYVPTVPTEQEEVVAVGRTNRGEKEEVQDSMATLNAIADLEDVDVAHQISNPPKEAVDAVQTCLDAGMTTNAICEVAKEAVPKSEHGRVTGLGYFSRWLSKAAGEAKAEEDQTRAERARRQRIQAEQEARRRSNPEHHARCVVASEACRGPSGAPSPIGVDEATNITSAVATVGTEDVAPVDEEQHRANLAEKMRALTKTLSPEELHGADPDTRHEEPMAPVGAAIAAPATSAATTTVVPSRLALIDGMPPEDVGDVASHGLKSRYRMNRAAG